MTEFTDKEVEMLRTIFQDAAVYEYIDSDNENCPYKALYEKIMGDEEN